VTSDRIAIRGLRVPTRIGVTDEERAREQIVVIDVELALDLATAGRTDDLSDTVDYDRLTWEIAGLVRASEVKLLEHLAETVAQRVCTVKTVDRVTVEVMKESTPVSEDVGAISVRITRP